MAEFILRGAVIELQKFVYALIECIADVKKSNFVWFVFDVDSMGTNALCMWWKWKVWSK